MSEKHICCDQVWVQTGRWGHRSPCGKTAKFERDGKWYCGIHDPEKRKARSAAWDAKYEAEREASRKKRQREEAAMELLELCERYDWRQWTPAEVAECDAILEKARAAK